MLQKIKKLINCTLKKFKNKNSENTPNRERNKSDNLPIVILAEGICERLIGTKFEKLLLKDFHSISSFTYKDYESRQSIYNKLNVIMNEILKYLDLPQKVKLNIIYNNDDKNNNAGFFSTSSTSKTITIKIDSNYGPKNFIAVLCHECTHYFMEYYGFNSCDKEINERRTDVFSNLIGFGKIMEEGYEETERIEEHENYSKIKIYKIGYISAEDCRTIRKEHKGTVLLCRF